MKNIKLFACALLLSPFASSAQSIFESELCRSTQSIKAKEYYDAGKDAYERHKVIDAIANFKAAIAEDSDYVDAYNALGFTYQGVHGKNGKGGKSDSALYCFQESHRRYPDGAAAIRWLGMFYSVCHNVAKAAEYLEQAVALDPCNPVICHVLAMSYFNMGKTTEALEYAQKAEKYYKQTNSRNLGDCYTSLYLIYVQAKNEKQARKYRKLAEAAGKFTGRLGEAWE
jgi:tetratricopeptide (TPR) repeat protein